MSQDQPGWIGHILHDRYRIEELLGTGGMAIVYKATDLNLQREVAIKLIHYHLAQQAEFVKRFKREADAVAKLRHPNIVPLYDFRKDRQPYYMVLAYVDGESLDERLKALEKSNQLLPLSEIIHIMSRLCHAVAYAHQRNIIHRDLKPSNVLFDQNAHLYLTDFGIARIAGEDHTMTVTGTAYYMSPEQARGEQTLDQCSDIYSLGVMLYQMACGQTPFQGSQGSLVFQHTQEPVPDIRLFNSTIPTVLVEVIEKALAKKPADRFQSANEMATALGVLEAPPDRNSSFYTTRVLDSDALFSEVAEDLSSTPPTGKRQPLTMLAIGVLLAVVVIMGVVMLSGVFSLTPPPATPAMTDNKPLISTVTTLATVTGTTNEVTSVTATTDEVSTVTATTDEVVATKKPVATLTRTLVALNAPVATPTVTPVSADLRFGVMDRGMNCLFISQVVARILEQEQEVSVEIVEYQTNEELFAALASKDKEIDLTLCVADPQDRPYISQHVGYIKQIGDAIWDSEEAKWLVMVNGSFVNPLEREMPCVYDFFQKLQFDDTDFEERDVQRWIENNTEAIQLWNSCALTDG